MRTKSRARSERPQPGDLVENLNHPDLDYRIVISTGIAQEPSGFVDEGEHYVTLNFPGGESAPLPAALYRVVETAEEREKRQARVERERGPQS